ncbi:MAG: hypothetical protein HYS17_00540 [Micavibrio aeruginosavorus]|uniref:Uncharacterized protein n=1 Tax=Micavibrio aeruginosavorus TaxID=349221 RepID=A0A7T5R2I0_9BACT|nr:MAG: hypothetical protein HYS17_00540 [Micavibrio aeruginosavorus]
MTGYVYIHTRPLQAAQRYDFAECADHGFIREWRSFRQEIRKRLTEVAESSDEAGVMGPDCPPDAITVFDLMQTERGLWILIKKFEVFGKFYDCYRDDGLRHPQSVVAPVSAYVCFADLLLQKAAKGECFQYHSTLLKLMDALCALPAETMDFATAQKVIRLIDGEEALVEKLEKDVYGI